MDTSEEAGLHVHDIATSARSSVVTFDFGDYNESHYGGQPPAGAGSLETRLCAVLHNSSLNVKSLVSICMQ